MIVSPEVGLDSGRRHLAVACPLKGRHRANSGFSDFFYIFLIDATFVIASLIRPSTGIEETFRSMA
jgi:hypothetical protein